MFKFSFKTRRIKEYNELAPSFIKRIKLYSDRVGAWPDKDKITLKEYGILSDINSLKIPLPKEIYKDTPVLKQLFKMSNEINPTLDSMKQSYQTHLQGIKGHGVLAMLDDKKRSTVQGISMSWWRKLRYMVSSKFHASIVYRQNPEGSLTETHLCNSGFAQNDFDYKSYIYSDLYRIDLTKLINDENKSKLFKLYGANWKDEISRKYLDMQRKIHDDAITNSKFGKITLADVTKRGFFSIFKHKKFKETDFKKVHSKKGHYVTTWWFCSI